MGEHYDLKVKYLRHQALFLCGIVGSALLARLQRILLELSGLSLAGLGSVTLMGGPSSN
jgi:hypothetical protein